MIRIQSVSLAIALVVFGTPAWANTQDEQHQAHHPASAESAAVPPAAPAPASEPTDDKSNPALARMDTQMKAMREMHGKMMAAKTPEERNALMAEHMKVMQDGMQMMNAMPPGDMGAMGMMGGMPQGSMGKMPNDMAMCHQMMGKRMEMMQAMMQMMMDQLSSSPSK